MVKTKQVEIYTNLWSANPLLSVWYCDHVTLLLFRAVLKRCAPFLSSDPSATPLKCPSKSHPSHSHPSHCPTTDVRNSTWHGVTSSAIVWVTQRMLGHFLLTYLDGMFVRSLPALQFMYWIETDNTHFCMESVGVLCLMPALWQSGCMNLAYKMTKGDCCRFV